MPRPRRPTSSACRWPAAASGEAMNKRLIFGAGAVVAVIAGVIAWNMTHQGYLPVNPKAATPPNPTTQTIQRGEYLARAGDCVACHTEPTGKLFAGGRAMATPFGAIYVPNITPDDETGIGRWTADDFYRMMHTGLSRDGTLLYPAMPFAQYTKVTRADRDAIFAYLQSLHAGEAEEQAARAALPVQQARAPARLAHALLQGRRVRARPGAIGAMESRRVSRRGARALHHVPHGDQRARRLEGVEGIRGRDDPEPELVRALAHQQPRGRPGRLEPAGHLATCCRWASRSAPRRTARWPR